MPNGDNGRRIRNIEKILGFNFARIYRNSCEWNVVDVAEDNAADQFMFTCEAIESKTEVKKTKSIKQML